MSIEVLSVRGLRPECGKVDRDLWLWFCEAKKDSENYHGPRVTKRLVQAKAKEAFQAAGILNFKASDGWYIRWLKRWHRIGLDNAKRLVTKDVPLKKTDNGIQPKKRNPQRPKTNIYQVPNICGSLQISNISNVSEGSIIGSSVEASSSARKTVDDYSAQTKSDIFKEVEDVQLNFSENALASIPSISHSSTANQRQSLPAVACNPYISKNCSAVPLLENSPFVNSDEAMWNSLSGLEKHKSSSNAMQNHGNDFVDEMYSSKEIPQKIEFALLHHLNKSRKKIPIKAATKLLHFHQLSLPNDCISMAVPMVENERIKNGNHQVCFELMQTEVKNSYIDCSNTLASNVNIQSEKEMKMCPESSLFSSIPSVLLTSNSNDNTVTRNLLEEELTDKSGLNCLNYSDEESVEHIVIQDASNECLGTDLDSERCKEEEFLRCARAKSFSSNLVSGEPMVVCDRNGLQEADLILEKDGTVCEENFSDLINVESANDCTESMCENFATDIVQNDLEDVSVSSDFVNQLNDEHSLELNLGYENLVSHICCENNLNQKIKGSNTNVVSSQKESQSAFVHQVASDSFQDQTCPLDSQAGVGHSEADGDFSGEENDYISEAVMLSMQEDDFSILNCDHSPFQGTISVIDEDSQTECERITQLEKMERGSMDGTLDSRGNSSGVQGSEFQELYVSSHVVVEKTSSDLQNAPFSSFSLKQGICSDSSSILLPPAGKRRDLVNKTEKTQNKLGYALHRQATYQTSSALNGNLAMKDQEEVCLPSMGPDVVVHRQNMCHESPKDAVEGDGIIESQDVFLAACLSGVNFSHAADNQQTAISSEGSICAKTEEISSVYIMPFATQKEVNLGTTTHLAVSNLTLDNCMEPSIDSHMESYPRVTIANADSTTFLVPHSTCDLTDPNTPMMVSLSSPNAFVPKNTSLPTSHFTSQINNFEGESTITTLSQSSSSRFSERPLVLETSNQIQPLSNSINCESTKENGYHTYDMQLVESVESNRDIVPKTQPKLPKKNAAYLTEKGSNTARINNSVEDYQTTCRRSSGDRYFPYFKEKVVDYAIKHTAKEAARSFGVNVDTVTMWTKGRYDSYSISRNQPDQIMLRWLKRNRENGAVLTREQLVEKAVQLTKTPGSWLKDKSRWFYIWASRLADESKKSKPSCDGVGKLPVDCGEKKALYPDEFKVEVVLYAEQTSKNLASTVFNIARKRVFEWSSLLKVSKGEQEEHFTKTPVEDHNLQNAPTNDEAQDLIKNQGSHQSNTLPASLSNNASKKYKLNGKGLGRAVTSVAVDRELWDWFCEQTAKKSKPKSREIRAKAVELFRAHNHDKIQCSHGWLKKWSMRYGIALRHEGDCDLLAWCLKQFDCNRNISHRDLLSHAQESLAGIHKSEFKASAGWLNRFCKRHRSLLSAKPMIDIEIPSTLKPNISEFRSQIQHLIHSSSIPYDSIGSMDEVPLNFTAAGSGSQSRLLLRRSGLENCHATVVLSCLANGKLLPPAVIFKGEGPTEEVTLDGVTLLLLYQKDCSMTPTCMLEWLKFVWTRNAISPSVLVADCFEPHCSDLVKNACTAAHVSLSIIPAGCSYKLQPLDLSISRQFEANIYNRWTRHFSDVDQLSACKRSLYSSNTDIAKWIAEAYSNLQTTRKEAICRSFLVTGLTAAVNGADDHLLEDPSHIPFSTLSTSQS